MEDVVSVLHDLPACCEHMFSDQGQLSTAITGFVARAEQTKLAKTIAECIQANQKLVAEAGTGTGKTFAYLVPCLLSGKKALISTATKTLQDQLYQKDLPILARVLGRSIRVQNLKGRANYICRYRTELHCEEGRLFDEKCKHEILFVQEKIPKLIAGERNELPEIHEDSSAWPYVTSTVDNCLGIECTYYQQCFLVKARKKAMDADVVVINHHIFFADSRLKQEGFGALLPGVEIAVFDEAHQLPEIATNFYGERISSRQLKYLIEDILREWPILDLVNQPLKEYRISLDKVVDKFLTSLPERLERLDWQEALQCPGFQENLLDLQELIEQINDCFSDELCQAHKGLKRCQERLEALRTLMTGFITPDGHHILWLERFKHSIVFHLTPFDVAASFKPLLHQQTCAYIFTSATLTMAGSFSCFTQSLGIEEVQTLALPSPFDFQKQAILYLPRNMPDTKDRSYYELLLAGMLPVIKACGGRCFFLFTSHRALQFMAKLLAQHIHYPLLIQGDEAKPILLTRFREAGNAILLGTATFWEGVDVKGEALSCVIIDKLPFASPTDPVIRGKMAYLKSKGQDPFNVLTLPNAILALKQGVGRLIRDVSDKGVLVIADPRLTGRWYGEQVFKSLPKMPRTREKQRVLTFIKEILI